MNKRVSIIKIKEDARKVFDSPIDEDKDLVFRELFKDTIGKSGSSPTWGYVYENKNGDPKYKGIGLYKEFDYDVPKAAYAEKIWSIIGKKTLKDTRVPDIDLVEDKDKNPTVISYRLMNNDKEDLIHISDILFNKFEREEIKKRKDIFCLDDILESIRIQIYDEENYEKVKKSVIQTILLDSITNNGDRHPRNWALIRDKETNYYDLATYDHSSAFVDMLEDRSYFTTDGWVSTYIDIKKKQRNIGLGDDGNKWIKFIYENYREYFDEFFYNFEENFQDIIDQISQEGMNIDMKRLTEKLKDKKKSLKKLYREGELEYER